MRCQLALGQNDAGRATFESGVEVAHDRRIYLFEMLMVRDYIVGVEVGSGGEVEVEVEVGLGDAERSVNRQVRVTCLYHPSLAGACLYHPSLVGVHLH